MQKDQLLTRRRALFAGATVLGAAGAAGTVGLLLSGSSGPGPAPAAGPPARRSFNPSAYRLLPMTGGSRPHEPLTTPAGGAPIPVRRAPILRMSGRGRTMLLTFDDGPNPDYTPRILDILAKYDVRATFFVCGEMADWNKDLLARMADEGHTVGNHTWTHPLLTRRTRRQIRVELESTCDIIEKAYGQRPQWFRAPYGAWNRTVFQVEAELGMEPLAWTVDSLDWTTPGTSTIVRRVERGAGSGVVVLSHDAGGDRTQTVRALRTYLPRLLDEGYRFTVPRRSQI
ncbi:oligosaccharide deacetylase [Streptomyces sp. F-3]|jgi:peptidoglycan/xylan/chitin deacetylase (PgdA/CDA1 family)|uniref:Polysaccharide deacetylase family protein n=1 Tax=Streptomyces thermogriseus TaxID=75292 RepID=A0ABN1SU47_9ACTN|nr:MULTISPECIES: polysaccharide deacetylase family protein [unclassified Streptomyces]MDN5383849.1 polysaccharide deacetylase family protein [Streptomyces sp. LB8]GAT79615.1 oligosaccharide deacetylase [Streptomyces sp. F-3]